MKAETQSTFASGTENTANLGKRKNNIFSLLVKNKVLLALLILCVILSVSTDSFLEIENIKNIFLQSAVMGIVAIGMTFVIITAGIDLGVGSVVALTGIFVAGMAQAELPILLIVIGVLIVGGLCGITNGFFITKFNMAPFIVTLGMMSAARSITIAYTDAQTISVHNDVFLKFIRSGTIAGIPVLIIITLLLFVIAHYVLSYTVFGRYVYAIGSNKKAAELSGINVKRVELMVYTIAGILAGIGGLLMTARLGSGTPLAGSGLELMAIAAVVIGGTSLMGGRGTIFGTLVGVILINVINTGMNLLNISSHYQGLVMGGVIIVAAFIDSVSSKK